MSRNRRRVQEVMDACTAEIARRYQSGEATVDDLLAGRLPPATYRLRPSSGTGSTRACTSAG